MANLTLSIDSELLRRARVRAAEDGTSVNAIVREFLVEYAGEDRARRAMARFIELADRAPISGYGDRTWTRDDLYDR